MLESWGNRLAFGGVVWGSGEGIGRGNSLVFIGFVFFIKNVGRSLWFFR